MERRHHFTRGRTLRDPAIPVGAERFRLEGDHAPHDHDFLELVLVTGGAGTHGHIYGRDEFHPPAVAVIRPGDWHQYLACRGLELVNLYVGPELLDGELGWLHGEPGYGFLYADTWNRGRDRYTRHIPVRKDAARRAGEVLLHLESGANRIEGIGLFLLFLGHLRDDFMQASGDAKYGPLHPAVVRGMHLMRTRPEAPWSMAGLSTQLNGIHPSYLSRLFKRDTGSAPMAWLARVRAEKAAALLRRTTEDIASVGAAVGWDDPNYFARRFRQIFGTTPSHYRAEA